MEKLSRIFFSLFELKKLFIRLQTVNWNSWNTLGALLFESENFKRKVSKKKNVQINIYAGKQASKETVRTNVTVTAGRTKNKHGKLENGNKT